MNATFQILLSVFVGGFLGSLARELLTPLLPAPFPWLPTLLINVAASFALGCLYPLRHRIRKHLLHLSGVGFCGGFSTFSHFIEEIISLATDGRYQESALYLVGSIVIAIGAALSGEMLMQPAGRRR